MKACHSLWRSRPTTVFPRERMSLVSLLFSIATVAERHGAECWPRTRPLVNPAGEKRAREAVETAVPQLFDRWVTECVAVRLSLAAIAAAFPSAGASQDLLPDLRTLAGKYPGRTLPGDYVRLAGIITVGRCENVFAAVEALTTRDWTPTARSAPIMGRAIHLLDQMLGRIRATTKTQNPCQLPEPRQLPDP
ncbi:UNVERIFIED_CONTAM: hypothetical protein RKD43_006137 [Streptomyces graminofaciens]